MTKFVASLSLVLSLMAGACSPSPPENNEAEFAQTKTDMLQKMRDTNFKSNPIFLCAAKRVSDETVRTTYLIWLYKRGDLATKAQTDAASLDQFNSIEECGGDVLALAREVEKSGDVVYQGLTAAMLEAGR